MSPELALARLRVMLQPTSEPVLTEQEVSDLLYSYALADTSGALPDDPGWVGTWDIRAAARQGWLTKAGKVAGDPTYRSDTASYNMSDVYEHCMAMAKKYAPMGSISVGV